ncbi:MAG: ribonuclease Z [Ruminococcaceae bacterium]|nr:ribonuclease Z [Oscillospiraceae bacterium]
MKKITVALCLDDGLGMTFCGKRQSRDRLLIDDLLQSIGSRPLWIHPYSSLLFEGKATPHVSERPMEDCPGGAVCFLETEPPTAYLPQIDRILLYRWNRLYPSDLRFQIDPRLLGYRLTEVSEFAGSSHDRITKEVYEK